MQTPLPVDAHVESIVEHLRRERFAVVVAPPGAGKTTRIPPALAALGRTILLQPRRVAARALARRIAAEQGWRIGEEVGWQIRFERRFTPSTQLLVATEGILTARLQSDPLLSDFRFVVLDEFHERSIHADLALALAKEAALTRDDLGVVVMSATIDAARVAEYLHSGGQPARVFAIEAKRHPVEIVYRAASVADAVRELLPTAVGDLLAFLPGVREIERARTELGGVDALVLPLHGTLDVAEQERALAPAKRRKIILATNVAETSLTVEGVSDVIDSGVHKLLRYDSGTGVDHLLIERISADSAEQRAGRAGRTGPGRATRLWDSRDLLRPHREAEIRRVDLAAPLLDVIAWGADPQTFDWFERPPQERLDAGITLLRALGAIELAGADTRHRLTDVGEMLRQFPLHPRLARMIVAADGADAIVAIAAAISEGVRLTRSDTTRSDAFALADSAPREVVRELTSIARRLVGHTRRQVEEETLLRAILAGYPDRVAVRREGSRERLLLASGTGAVMARESGVREGEFLVALEVAGREDGESLVRVASFIEREWLTPTHRTVAHSIANGRVRAIESVWYGAILLYERPAKVDEREAQRLRAESIRGSIDPLLERRVAFAQVEVDWDAVAEAASAGGSADIAAHLPFHVRRKLDELAPSSLELPSGRSTRLDYREDGSVVASAKLQELFGLAETPRLGPGRVPVTIELLAPNGRPVQVTRDLRSFWDGTYAEVRKELRGRYPKHPWPDDPWTAEPTHRAKRRR